MRSVSKPCPRRHWGQCITKQVNPCISDTQDNPYTTCELSKIANYCGIIKRKTRKTARETLRKRAEMMTLSIFCTTLNQIPSFHSLSESTLAQNNPHSNGQAYNPTPNTWGEIESANCRKYQRLYQQQRSAAGICPHGHKFLTRPSTILETGNLLTTIHKKCLDSLRMKISLGLQRPLPKCNPISSK